MTSPIRLLERGSAEWPACLAHLGAGEPKRLHVRGPLKLIDRRKLVLPEPIKSLGTHVVPAKLHADVEFPVTVEVVAE